MKKEVTVGFVHTNGVQYGNLDQIIEFLQLAGVNWRVTNQIKKLRDEASKSPNEYIVPCSCPSCGNRLIAK